MQIVMRLVVGDHQVLELVCVSSYDFQVLFFIITIFRMFSGSLEDIVAMSRTFLLTNNLVIHIQY